MQEELDNVALLWNTHRIRPVRNSAAPSGAASGKPVTMYNLPELVGAQKQSCRIPEAYLRVCAEECEPKKHFPCDETVFELCLIIMDENFKAAPKDVDEAISLYKFLRYTMRTNLVFY